MSSRNLRVVATVLPPASGATRRASAAAQRQSIKPETIAPSMDAQGGYFWNQSPVSEPESHIRGDKAVRYEFAVHRNMSTRAGRCPLEEGRVQPRGCVKLR